MHNYRFEAGGQGQHSIQKVPILKGIAFSRAEAVGWLESVTAALDCYNWVFKEQLFSPSELFDGKINHTTHQLLRIISENELLNVVLSLLLSMSSPFCCLYIPLVTFPL